MGWPHRLGSRFSILDGSSSRTLHCKVIMAAAEKIYLVHGADERTKPGRCMVPVAGLKFIDRTDREIHPERALRQRAILHG
jgi:hypothetical protein